MPRLSSLSLDILRTFALLSDNEGDAAKTRRQLKIEQPSMSKRLRYLQRASPVLKKPWIELRGKTWKLTEEGVRALPAVRELIDRYEQLTTYIADKEPPDQGVRFACGRQVAATFVREGLRRFREQHGHGRVRISTLRGESGIIGVANGSLDLALVAFEEDQILEIARRRLHVEMLARHSLALVAEAKSHWGKSLAQLPKDNVPLTALTNFPLILPEPDAPVRQQFDQVLKKRKLLDKLDVQLEVGGWSSILNYVRDGAGVGLVSESFLETRKGLVIRSFRPSVLRPTPLCLICRYRFDAPGELDLSPLATDFYQALKKTVVSRKVGNSTASARP